MTSDERMDRIEDRLTHMEKLINQVKTLAIGIAIGLLLAGVIFGYITWKEAVGLVK